MSQKRERGREKVRGNFSQKSVFQSQCESFFFENVDFERERG